MADEPKGATMRGRFTSMTRVLPVPVTIVVHALTYSVGVALTLRVLALVCGVRLDEAGTALVMVASGLAGVAGGIACAITIFDEQERERRGGGC